MLKQVGLLTAGAQPWNSNICDAHGNWFAYCATLAIYIHEYDDSAQRFKLHSIMCEHKKTITSIAWHKTNINLIASCSSDGLIIVWNIKEQKTVTCLDQIKTPITNIEWYQNETDTLSFMTPNGPLLLWKITEISKISFTTYKNSNHFSTSVCLYKWNQNDKNKVCYGHIDGSISISSEKMNRYFLGTVNSESSFDKDYVLSLEWDPLSVDYILVLTEHSGIRLIDTLSKTLITHFKLPKMDSQIRKVCWISSAPGMFVSGDSNSAILRVWSVAQDTPIASKQIKETGFHSMHLMSDLNLNKMTTRKNTSSSSLTHKKSYEKRKSLITIPPASIVSVFVDGGLGVYDLKRENWIFLREKGHIETIFACDFHPNDPNILATASFDGSIKVWDITTMNTIHVSPGNLSVVYSLSWGPGDSYSIFAATLKYGAILWDISNTMVTKQYNDHGGKGVYACSWNHMDPTYFASAGADNQCIVKMTDSTGTATTKIYKHPAVVYGCDWCPSNRDLLATGCEDGIVRIFYIPGKCEPLKIFAGHSEKVFNVKWSPLKDGILCSGSDDNTIRIWDYTKDDCIQCLEGHTSHVRGLLWSPELPNILISGSWDATIRVWDTRTGYCLEVIHDHAADIYGLACHRHRPFLLASTSRDSTLRLWTMKTVVQPMYASLVLDHDITFLTENATILGPGDVPFAGIGGDFMKFMEAKKEDSLQKKLQMYSHFLLPPVGISNFWILVSILLNKKKAVLPNNYGDMIMHISHLTSYKASKAQVLETTKSNFHQLIGPKKKAEQLSEAARVYMSLGQTERYCEIMIELDQWEKALAVAPAVSTEYWKKLARRYASMLTDDEDKEAPVYWMASQDINKLCESYLERNQYHDAMMAVQVAIENNLKITDDDARHDGMEDGKHSEENETDASIEKLYRETNEKLAGWYFADGDPVSAACCHLSVNDVQGAICKLVRGNELELAYSLAKLLDVPDDVKKEVAIMFSFRCEKYQLWDAAITLWSLVKDNEFELILFCARYQGAETERNAIHEKVELPSTLECLREAGLYSQKGKLLKSCLFYSVSTQPEKALDIALANIKSIFKQNEWSLDDVLPYSKVLSALRSDVIQALTKEVLAHVLAVCAYMGALQAIRYGYTSIILPLYQTTVSCLKNGDVDMGITSSFIQSESEAWLVKCVEDKSNNATFFTQKTSPQQMKIYEDLITKCGCAEVVDVRGEFLVLGQYCPAHTVTHVHYFTKEKIKGPVFLLEDGHSALPHNFALMWAKVNLFSPLGTGTKINPF